MVRSPGVRLVAFAATLSLAPAQAGWVQRQPASSPPASAALLAWSPTVQKVWWVGSGTTGVEVWAYDGTTWSPVPAAGPAPSSLGPATYDPVRHRVVGLERDDVWEFDGAAWTKITPAAQPTPLRTGFDLAFDELRGEVLMGGGEDFDPSGGPYAWYIPAGDLWAWTGSTWVRRYNGGGGPGAGTQMVYDRGRGRMVFYGGHYSVPYHWTGQQTFYVVGNVWEWDGTTMSLGQRGSKRTSHAVAYDALRQRVVTFGGFATCGYACSYQPTNTDEYDGAWDYRAPSPTPGPTNGAQLAFDEARQRMVLVVGTRGGPVETWEYFTQSPAHFAPFGAGCPGTAGTPTLALDGGALPWLGETFGLRLDGLVPGAPAFVAVGVSSTTFGTRSLPLSLTGIGAPGCFLLVSPDVVESAGTADSAGTARWQLAIPNQPSLLGATFYTQGVAVDAAANALGLTFSNGGAATVEAL